MFTRRSHNMSSVDVDTYKLSPEIRAKANKMYSHGDDETIGMFKNIFHITYR